MSQAGFENERSRKGTKDVHLWSFLQDLGSEHLNHLRSEITQKAPVPGALILVDVRTFPSASGFDAAIFSAIDVCTHLQVIRPYFLSSKAAAADFLSFLQEAFPFDITEVRTPVHSMFSRTNHVEGPPFALLAEKRSIRHTTFTDASDQGVLAVLASYFFPLRTHFPGSAQHGWVSDELKRFVFFHNNNRSLATLGGKTPVQSLRSFPGFNTFTTFDPILLPDSSR